MMRDLDFSLRFYVQRNRYIQVFKSDLIHINKKEEGDLYFALIDSSILGPGSLRCEVSIKDSEPRWMKSGMRPIKLDYATGLTIGSHTSMASTSGVNRRAEYDEGFKVTFNHVWGILCHPLLLLPSVFPSNRVFFNELFSSQQVAKVLKLQHQSFR